MSDESWLRNPMTATNTTERPTVTAAEFAAAPSATHDLATGDKGVAIVDDGGALVGVLSAPRALTEAPPAEGDPLAEMRSLLELRKAAYTESIAGGIDYDDTRQAQRYGELVGAADVFRIAERAVLPALTEARATACRLEFAMRDAVVLSEKLRTRCRNQRRELRDQERRRERVVSSCMHVFAQCCADNGLLAERTRAAEIEVARLTEACDQANASNERRLADMQEADADRAALRDLVASIEAWLGEIGPGAIGVFHQLNGKAWSKARERVRK